MLEEISLEEIIAFSKKESSPPFVIIDELSEEELEYAKTIAQRLRIGIVKVKDTNKVAVVNNRLSEEQGQLLANEIKEMYNIQSVYDKF